MSPVIEPKIPQIMGTVGDETVGDSRKDEKKIKEKRLKMVEKRLKMVEKRLKSGSKMACQDPELQNQTPSGRLQLKYRS